MTPTARQCPLGVATLTVAHARATERAAAWCAMAIAAIQARDLKGLTLLMPFAGSAGVSLPARVAAASAASELEYGTDMLWRHYLPPTTHREACPDTSDEPDPQDSWYDEPGDEYLTYREPTDERSPWDDQVLALVAAGGAA